LATPLILDLTILTELLTRVKYRDASKGTEKGFEPLYSVLSLLSYMLKAPLVKPGTFRHDRFLFSPQFAFISVGTEVINSLGRQRNALESFLKACIGLEGSSDLLLESRIW
jgi:myo-inositol-1-phosphate synthase